MNAFVQLFKFALTLPSRTDDAPLFDQYTVDSLVGTQLLRAVQEAGEFEVNVWRGSMETTSRRIALTRVVRIRMLCWNARIATESYSLQPAIKVGYRIVSVEHNEADVHEFDAVIGEEHFETFLLRLRESSAWCPPSQRDAGCDDSSTVGYLLW